MVPQSTDFTDVIIKTLIVLSGFCALLIVASFLRGRSERASLQTARARITEIKNETVSAKNEKGAMQEFGPFEVAYVTYVDAQSTSHVTRLQQIAPLDRAGLSVGKELLISYDPKFPGQVKRVEFLDNHGVEVFLSVMMGLFLLSAQIIRVVSTGDSLAASMPAASSADRSFEIKMCGTLVFFGVLLVGYAVRSLVYQAIPGNHGSARAQVIGFETAPVYHKSAYFDALYPVLRYQVENGSPLTVRSQSRLNFSRDWIGAEYPVSYSTKDPSIARPESSNGFTGGALFLLFVGLIPLAFGASWLLGLVKTGPSV
ncbi:DUF3592 domain-containing protein [Bdellovibrionota bacterium FG-1]